MRNNFYQRICFAAIFALCACSPVQAQGYVKVVNDLDCGAFRAHAETVATKPADSDSHVDRQAIRIIVPGKQGSVALDLHQKRLPNKELGRRLELDGTAYGWRCVFSKAGKPYLYIAFLCSNSDAKTCPYGMQLPGKEWDDFYDPEGHGFLKDPQKISRDDEAQLRHATLWDEMVGEHDLTLIYSQYGAGKQLPP